MFVPASNGCDRGAACGSNAAFLGLAYPGRRLPGWSSTGDSRRTYGTPNTMEASVRLGLVLLMLGTAPALAQEEVEEAPGPEELHITPFLCGAPCVDYEVGIELELD